MANCSSSASTLVRPASPSIWRAGEDRRPRAGRRSCAIMPMAFAAMDLFVVPTVSFRLLYGLLIMGHGRRQILWLGVTAQPTAEWIANRLTAACGWEQIPHDLIRDRDACYGSIFVRRVRSLGIRDHPTSARSPWQNGYAERLIGSIRSGMPRPCHRIWRATPKASAVVLHGVLQRGAHPSIVGQGCAHLEGHSARRPHRSATCAWWTAPSVRADLICGRDS